MFIFINVQYFFSIVTWQSFVVFKTVFIQNKWLKWSVLFFSLNPPYPGGTELSMYCLIQQFVIIPVTR